MRRRRLGLALVGLWFAAAAHADDPSAAGNGGWELVDDDAGVRVERSAAAEGRVAYRAATRIEHPAEAVKRVLKDLETFPDWASRLHTWEVLAREGDEALVYGRHDVPWPVADRDYVVRYRCGGEGDGFFLEARSVPAPDDPAPDGVVRIADLYTLWEVSPAPDPSASLVRYTYRGDLGGRVPDWVQELLRGGSMRSSFERLAARVDAIRSRDAAAEGEAAAEAEGEAGGEGVSPKDR